MSTIGGTVVTVTGAGFGLNSSLLAVSYAGGSLGLASRAYNATSCVVAVAETTLRCSTAPGVGANYSFVVAVASGRSEPR